MLNFCPCDKNNNFKQCNQNPNQTKSSHSVTTPNSVSNAALMDVTRSLKFAEARMRLSLPAATNAWGRVIPISLGAINPEFSYMNVRIVVKRRSRPNTPRRASRCLPRSAKSAGRVDHPLVPLPHLPSPRQMKLMGLESAKIKRNPSLRVSQWLRVFAPKSVKKRLMRLKFLEKDSLKSRITRLPTLLTRFNWRRCELRDLQWRQHTKQSHLTSNIQALRRMEVLKRWYTLLPLELMVSHLNSFFCPKTVTSLT